MNAQAKWEKTEKNVGVLEVSVEAESVSDALTQAFKKVVKQVNVPGFRKGKVPRQLFEKRFGVESLYNDALDILLPEAYMHAVIDSKINPVSRPDIEVVQIEQGKSLIFKATVTVKPEVDLGDYKGLQLEKKEFAVTDEQVEAELETLRKNHAELITIEDGQTIEGDQVTIDFLGSLDGVPFEGGEAENYQLEIGSNTFIPGFEDQLVGMAKEEHKDINVTFPADYHVPTLAGQEVVFAVTLHEIKRKQLPNLDDEFAKDVSEFETLDELRADLRTKLEEQAVQAEKRSIEEQAVEKAVEAATIDLPHVMVHNEIETMLEEFKQRLQTQGIPYDAYLQITGGSEDQVRAEMHESAEKRVRTQLVLEAIANAEEIAVSDEDVDAELSNIAETAKLEVDQVRSILSQRDSNFAGMKSELATRKTIEFLVNNSQIA
ncbi:MAG: trigger factor [Bacilli bacterium]|nr:trigger factor [Bacilli bacterium]